MAPDEGDRRGFRSRLTGAFRPKTFSKLSKPSRPGTARRSLSTDSPRASASQTSQYEIPKSRSTTPIDMVHRREVKIDSQLGESKDSTALLHSLVYDDDAAGDATPTPPTASGNREGPQAYISKLSKPILDSILSYLTPLEAASLVSCCKALLRTLGLGPWQTLNLPENHQHRIRFLLTMDESLPDYLLCFLCASYHHRIQIGHESLKPATTLNPLYECPKVLELPFPRARITPRRILPFSFVQLATRAERYGPAYGIPAGSLSRRWKEDHWFHQTTYAVIKGRMYMRVSSSCFAQAGLSPSETRLLLFSREDYSPYFSACAHWRDGMLMDMCKCALGHIPKQRDSHTLREMGQKVSNRLHNRMYDPMALMTLCNTCKPMRRCPDCASEYLIDLKHMEDKTTNSFKRAIMVTRWCDLGDGSSPASREWAACNGDLEGYDSISAIGNRSISGMFEALFTPEHIPAQRTLNLNPTRERHSHDDPSWY